MKNCICGILMLISLCLAIGFIGGLECDYLTAGQAAVRVLSCITVFVVAGKIGGVIE